MLEEVRVNSVLKLACWRSNRVRVSRQFAISDRLYEPAPLDYTTLQAIRFPGAPARYSSVGELFEKVLEALSKFSGLATKELQPVPYWVLASWFPEILPALPTLMVVGPSPAAIHRFLRLLRCFCRRGTLVTELTPAGLMGLPMYLRPTLLIEQGRLLGQVRGLLRASSNAGVYVPRAGEFVDLRCVKAVYCESDEVDSELSEGVLRVSLFPAGASAPVFDESEEEQVAATFQAWLLRYRFENFQAVCDSSLDFPGFTAGVRDLARALGAVVAGDPNLMSQLTSLLAANDEDVRATWTMSPDFAVVVSTLALVHEKQPRVPVKQLADFVNAALRANGEIKEYSPIEIGRRLSRLGLPRSRRAGGMVIELTRDISRRVHDLKKMYGLTTSPASIPGCPDCDPVEGRGSGRQLV